MVSELLDLNEEALDLLESKRENIFLLKDKPVEWFPFLADFKIHNTLQHIPFQGELFTQQDSAITVDIKTSVVDFKLQSFLVVTVRKPPQDLTEESLIRWGNGSLVSESSRFSKLFRALNAASENMDREITPEGVFNAVKNQFNKLGFSCSIYITTPDLQYIYPKYLSYSPLVIGLAARFFGNPFEFMIPVEKIGFARDLVFRRKTLFVDDPRSDLAELFVAIPELDSVKGRIIEWMGRFLKKTVSAPLIIENKVIGALTVHSNDLLEKDTTAISAFAHQVAVALHKAKLLEDLQKNLNEKEKIEKALRISEARLRMAFEASRDAIWDYSIQTDQIYLGPRWYGMSGYELGEMKPDMKSFMKLIHPDDRPSVQEQYTKCFEDSSRTFSIDYRIKHKKGDWIFVRSKARIVEQNPNGKPTRFVGIISDITKEKMAEENLVHLAFHDALTGLMNRKAFGEKSDELLNVLRRKQEPSQSAYLYIDFDHFKDINDTFGHNVGDECLKQAAERLKKNVRESDLIFRLGGDEFFLILRDLNRPTDASWVAEKLIKAFQQPLIWNEQPLYLHLSLGISIFPKDGTETWQLLSNADTALYKAKGERNTYRFYDEAMQIEAIKKITIVNDIRNALEADEFQMYYQPILTCNRELVAAEALIRWFGADGSEISPTDFIPWAEESGLIIPIGLNVFNMVVKDIADWQQAGLPQIPVSINISARQLKQKGLIADMQKLLRSHSLSPQQFHLEITESSLMENLEEILEKLDLLKKSGLKFSIDDFGTGYSSLSHLKALPIDILKIDKSFITGLPDAQDAGIIKAIISMAQELELKVIAEGVETGTQFDFLQNNGQPLVQGFYFSEPLSKEDFAAFMKTGVSN